MKERLTLSPEQLQCLASPARYSVYNTLRQLGEAAANEIALQLGRSPKGLYYHLRELVRVGLVEEVLQRKVAKTEESVYRAVARHLELPAGAEARDWLGRTIAVLRLAEREARQTAAAGMEAERLKRGMNLFRSNVRLNASDARQLETMLSDAVAFAEGASHFDSGERIAITLFTLPVRD